MLKSPVDQVYGCWDLLFAPSPELSLLQFFMQANTFYKHVGHQVFKLMINQEMKIKKESKRFKTSIQQIDIERLFL